MSLPNELREQMLSGYLDDALSADERARVDQWLASDPDLAGELDQLRELRAALQAIGRAGSHLKLESGFADRVVDAAVARAQAEGLSEDHPLLRLAEQPTPSRRGRSLDWRWPASLAALAASIALAIFLFGGGNDTRPLANQSPTPESEIIAESTIGESANGESSEAAMLAESATDATVAPADVSENQLESTPMNPAVTPDQIATNEPQSTPPSIQEIDASESIAATESPKPMETGNSLEEQLLLGGAPVMVLSVRLTEAGKQSDAIGDALTNSQISANRQQRVTNEIAGFVAPDDSDLEGVADAKVLYLQAPLKSLDRFYLSLMADEEGIAKVGMTIAFNAPIRRVADALKVDPTTVQHDGRVLELVSSTPTVAEVASQLDDLPFDFNRTKVLKIQDDGPDEMGQVLVLVLP
jgi:hypothetical protein